MKYISKHAGQHSMKNSSQCPDNLHRVTDLEKEEEGSDRHSRMSVKRAEKRTMQSSRRACGDEERQKHPSNRSSVPKTKDKLKKLV